MISFEIEILKLSILTLIYILQGYYFKFVFCEF